MSRAPSLCRRVAPAEASHGIRDRLPVHLQDTLDEVQDPVVGHARPGVEAAFVFPVEREARLGDLDDERRPREVFSAEVSPRATGHGDVGLRLGVVLERDRPLRTARASPAQAPPGERPPRSRWPCSARYHAYFVDAGWS